MGTAGASGVSASSAFFKAVGAGIVADGLLWPRSQGGGGR